jgi:hypothetical protein
MMSSGTHEVSAEVKVQAVRNCLISGRFEAAKT